MLTKKHAVGSALGAELPSAEKPEEAQSQPSAQRPADGGGGGDGGEETEKRTGNGKAGGPKEAPQSMHALRRAERWVSTEAFEALTGTDGWRMR